MLQDPKNPWRTRELWELTNEEREAFYRQQQEEEDRLRDTHEEELRAYVVNPQLAVQEAAFLFKSLGIALLWTSQLFVGMAIVWFFDKAAALGGDWGVYTAGALLGTAIICFDIWRRGWIFEPQIRRKRK